MADEELDSGRARGDGPALSVLPFLPAWALAIGLILSLAIIAFWQTTRFGFLNYDDNAYIVKNAHVAGGVSWPNLVWALSTGHFGTWHPLTWLSHMLDVSLFGLNAGRHHLVNVILHLLNVLLLVVTFRALTSSFWRSALAGGLFAVHPLRVETVAWVADRKDLLSVFFFLLTLLAYRRYCRAPGMRRYLAVLLSFALGILSKATVVSLPLILLLLDFWPLNRAARPVDPYLDQRPTVGGRASWRLVAEKAPLLFLCVVHALVIYKSQVSAAIALETPQLGLRLANAVFSYVRYLGKTVAPLNLAVLYPFPQTMPPWWQTAVAAMALVAVSGGVVLFRRRRPVLALGWFWYLLTLFPASGVVQIGSGTQSMADRFTYLPLIGIFVLAAWTVGEASAGSPRRLLLTIVVCCSLLGVLTGLSFRQAGHWKDSVALWEHALGVTDRNYVGHNNLGMAYFDQGRFRDAEEQYREALAIRPNYTDAVYNLGTALYAQKRFQDALVPFTRALAASPGDREYNFGLAAAYMELGRCAEAIGPLRAIVRGDRGYKDASRRLEFCLQRTAPRNVAGE